MKYSDFSDASLMQLTCSGKHDAYSEIVARHTDRYFSLAFRTLQSVSDAEDIVQNAFIKLWQKPDLWNSNKSKFTTWFYRVIINACHDHIRKNKNHVSVDDEVLDAMVEPSTCEQSSLEQSETTRWQKKSLNAAIKALPLSQRDAINLAVYLAIPQKEVAEIMGVSVKAVESLLVRAKRTIAASIEKQPLDTNDAVVFAEDKPTEEKVLFLSKFFKPKFITPFAVAASIVFMAVLWVPSGFQQDETNPHFLSEAETSFSEDKEHLAEAEASFTVNDDLDFQETMVFFDEQMFVQL